MSENKLQYEIDEQLEQFLTHIEAWQSTIEGTPTDSDMKTLDGIPKLYYKTCVFCLKRNQAFEQRKWNMCIDCMIESREHQLELASTSRKRRNLRLLLKGAVELDQLKRADEIWRDIQAFIERGYVTANYRGKPCYNNFIGMTLTDKGRTVLGRASPA